MVQEDYHGHNPYHNAVHAADVTQAMHCYLKEPKVRQDSVTSSIIWRCQVDVLLSTQLFNVGNPIQSQYDWKLFILTFSASALKILPYPWKQMWIFWNFLPWFIDFQGYSKPETPSQPLIYPQWSQRPAYPKGTFTMSTVSTELQWRKLSSCDFWSVKGIRAPPVSSPISIRSMGDSDSESKKILECPRSLSKHALMQWTNPISENKHKMIV